MQLVLRQARPRAVGKTFLKKVLEPRRPAKGWKFKANEYLNRATKDARCLTATDGHKGEKFHIHYTCNHCTCMAIPEFGKPWPNPGISHRAAPRIQSDRLA